jgi:hypothetical protein
MKQRESLPELAIPTLALSLVVPTVGMVLVTMNLIVCVFQSEFSLNPIDLRFMLSMIGFILCFEVVSESAKKYTSGDGKFFAAIYVLWVCWIVTIHLSAFTV